MVIDLYLKMLSPKSSRNIFCKFNICFLIVSSDAVHHETVPCLVKQNGSKPDEQDESRVPYRIATGLQSKKENKDSGQQK